jgi:hypothetical protein
MATGMSAVTSGPDFGFVGLYICHPDVRGRGLGRMLWDAGIARLGNRTIGLDGVPAQQENYRRMGFAPAYRTWRHSGRYQSESVDPAVVSIDASMSAGISAFDRRHFPGPRPEFLVAWLDAPRIARAITRNGRVVAYGVIRRCHDGHKIGPLFAESEEDARAVFAALCAHSNGETVSIDVPEQAAAFSAHLGDLGFEKSFDTMRMYRGVEPDIDMAGVFGITTLELG